MAVTTEMREQVTQLYVALFDRAPDAEGLGYWVQQMAAGASMTDIANAMYGTAPARATYPLFLTNQEIIESFYQNVLGREGDAEGIAYWTGLLNDSTPGAVIVQMIDAVANYDGEDEAGLESAALFANKVEVAEYFAMTVGSIDGSSTALDGVTSNAASVDAAKAAIDGDIVSGVSARLTVGQDDLSGGAMNDVFTAPVAQNAMGSQVNTLGSGDYINGGGGTDTLNAKVTAGVFAGGGFLGSNSMPIQPETTSVEIVKLEAVEAGIGVTGLDSIMGEDLDLNTEVYVNAKDMYGVNQMWSHGSDADLTVLNMTTLANNGETMRPVNEMTVGMAYTGNSDSRWGASDFAVLFDQDYLVPVESSKSTAYYWILDEDADLVGNPNRLDFINVDGIRFTVDGGPIVTIESDAAVTAGTHEGFVAALQDALAQAIADGLVPADTTLTLDPTITDTTFLDDGSESAPVPAIVLRTESNATFTPVGFSQVEDALGEYDVWGRFSNEVDIETDLSINIALEKAGRAGEGGELVVGSMAKYGEDYYYYGDDYGTTYPNEWDSKFANAGIPTFNITVYGDESKPNSLSGIHSTNNVLETLIISTDAAETGENGYASLTIGNDNTFRGWAHNALKDVTTIDATAFKGDLSVWSGLTNELDDKNGYEAIELNYTFGSGNDYLWLDGEDHSSNEGFDANIAMGEGDDEADIWLDGDLVDAITESFSLDLGNGDNSAYLWVGEDVSFATTNLLKNLSVTSGSGQDYIEVEGYARWDIKSGGGSDFVYIDSGGWAGNATIWNTSGVAIAELPAPMYKAHVQVRYAGFEGTASINPGSDFIATAQDLNAALIAAIASNPELERLIKAEVGEGLQSLDIQAWADGNSLLEMTVFQPELIATGTPTDGQVLIASGDVTALGAALVKLDPATTSSTQVDTAAELATQFNNWAAAGYDAAGVGVAGWTIYEDLVIGSEGSWDSRTVINMGDGANDLVVLSSNDLAQNTLVFNAAWGKVSIVNFFTDEDSLVNGDVGTLGLHKLDFTAFLNGKTSDSGSVASQVAIPIEIDTTQTFAANNILVADVDDLEAAAGGTTNYSFAGLTAAQVKAALDAAGGFTAGSVADPTAHVGTTQTSLLFVENLDSDNQPTIAGVVGTDNYANYGEYKVFQVVYAETNPTEFTVTLLGVLDFGNSLDVATMSGAESVNLVGGAVAP